MEKPINKPFALIRKEIDKKLKESKKQFSNQVGEYRINYQWNGNGTELLVSSEAFQLKGRLVFLKGKLVVYAEIPFFLRPFAMMFKDQWMKILEEEISKIVELE